MFDPSKLGSLDCDTTVSQQSGPNPNDTTWLSNFGPAICGWNRKIRRYAKKHNITEEEAARRLYDK